MGSSGAVDTGTSPWMKVFAEDGTSAVLPCTLTAQQLEVGRAEKYARTSAVWTKAEGHGPVLSVGADGVLLQGRWILPRASVRRALFPSGDFSLNIHSIQYKDAGHYIGEVQYGGVRKTCHVLLHVIRVTASPSSLLAPGAPVTMICTSTDPLPLAEVCWYQGQAQRSCYRRLQPGWRELRLDAVTEADGGEWRCEHRYVDGSRAQARYTLQVQGFASPTTDPLTIYASVDSYVELPCILKHDPHGEVRVHWTHTTSQGSSRTIVMSEGARQGQETSSSRIAFAAPQRRNYSLSISSVWETDAGLYYCGLTSHGWQLSRSIRLVLVKVTLETPGLAREGTVVRLNCTLSEVFGEEQYSWTHLSPTDNGEGTEDGHTERWTQRKQHTGHLLELSPVSQDDAGTWTCTIHARNTSVAEVAYVLQVTGAQYAGPIFALGGKVSYAVALLILVLFVLSALTILALRNQRRRLSHFAALENDLDGSLTPSRPEKIAW
ncbi:lymphocyte activation gene 3 protein [Pleurodeles waltl]|uniref:lymphocyte activation gene 3 protein n=1 Tax=Pleurodeles waltl TaxID=8319 RepID=UPI0037095F5C